MVGSTSLLGPRGASPTTAARGVAELEAGGDLSPRVREIYGFEGSPINLSMRVREKRKR